MFNDEDPITFKGMQQFSAVDGFLEVNENVVEMIKYVANEPSVGLFYVQKHIQNATPNLTNLKNNVVEKSHATVLHTEDLEDSITMVRSMKECGLQIADEMIGEIKKSLSTMSRKQPKKGLLSRSGSGYLGRTSSWSPATLGHNAPYSQQDDGKTSGYLSGVIKSAKQTVSNLKWPQHAYEESNQSKGENPSFEHNPTCPSAYDGPSTLPNIEGGHLSSSSTGNELQEESKLATSLSHQVLPSLPDNYDEFKADREAKFEEWLERVGNKEHTS